ncbi:hypothetical protein STBA_36280 [Streptomyces sp. MP131-18]|nr:hypothetical protein STBA_36280 [Streptomyces sp. MP131-18]
MRVYMTRPEATTLVLTRTPATVGQRSGDIADAAEER